MLPLLDVQFEWCIADAKLSLLKYGSFVSVAVQVSVRHNLFVWLLLLVSYRSMFLHETGGILWLTL